MRPILPLCLAVTLLSGCGNLQNLATKARAKKQQKAMEKLAATSSEEAAARLGARAVGEVAYVDDAEQFVLIRALTGIQLVPETTLETRRDGKRTGLLRATPEKKNAFLAADLLEGTPQTGDGVFPSTAKPSPLNPGPAPAPSPVIPESTPSAPAAVSPPDSPPPTLVPADDLDPTNLPALKEAIKTPEDLKR
jgi:hypothetical protein